MNFGSVPWKVMSIPARIASIQVLLLILSSCSTNNTSFIPPTIKRQIDWTISFPQVKEAPSTYLGSMMIAGGEVLSAKRFTDQTRLIILQLPLSTNHDPVRNRTKSQGRFIARQAEFLDPATIPPGTRVTVIGEISGSTTELLDEMVYSYPVLTIKHLEVWPPPLPYSYGHVPGPAYPYPFVTY